MSDNQLPLRTKSRDSRSVEAHAGEPARIKLFLDECGGRQAHRLGIGVPLHRQTASGGLEVYRHTGRTNFF